MMNPLPARQGYGHVSKQAIPSALVVSRQQMSTTSQGSRSSAASTSIPQLQNLLRQLEPETGTVNEEVRQYLGFSPAYYRALLLLTNRHRLRKVRFANVDILISYLNLTCADIFTQVSTLPMFAEYNLNAEHVDPQLQLGYKFTILLKIFANAMTVALATDEKVIRQWLSKEYTLFLMEMMDRADVDEEVMETAVMVLGRIEEELLESMIEEGWVVNDETGEVVDDSEKEETRH
ncbi:hypothetical protein HK102_009573 [Quaeritorhiza haematococci]|nr:hypothetical protein HK102_009573 [Quaeritorhiza haematococci]